MKQYLFSMDDFRTEHEIIICDKCSGIGIYKWEELIDYHKGDYLEHSEVCDKCNGSGRLVKSTKIQIVYEPFNPVQWSNKNIRYKAYEKEKTGNKIRS